MFVSSVDKYGVARFGASDREHVVFIGSDNNLVYFDAGALPVESHSRSLRRLEMPDGENCYFWFIGASYTS